MPYVITSMCARVAMRRSLPGELHRPRTQSGTTGPFLH